MIIALASNSRNHAVSAQGMPWLSAISMCGCPDCTSDVFDSLAGPYSCLERIQYLIFSDDQLTEEQACTRVGSEYPDVCGKCSSATCRSPPTNNAPERIPVSAVETTVQNSSSNVPERIPVSATFDVVPERLPVSAVENNVVSPVSTVESSTQNDSDGSNNSDTYNCGCQSCTDAIFNSDASGHSFSGRVDYLKGANPGQYPKEKDACHQLASIEFPNRFQECDPEKCNASDSVLNASASTNSNANAGGGRSRQSQMDLYCFPQAGTRTTYENVWGRYTVQVKEDPDGEACGPGENVFSSRNTVSKEGNNLKLQYKKVGNEWQASEVRVLLPDSERYQYGTYAFGVKSIRVLDSRTGNVVSKVLPQSLVLGLFTWDPTEDYARHENYNHEVDIEVSRWNNPADADAQFLVQPPGQPQTYRFFTGDDGTSYQQDNRVYGFDWRPTEIEWFSNAGGNTGGQNFVYSTQSALDAGKPDYTQCMPRETNNVEVRINLWNLLASEEATPPGMLDTHVVEVVIDNFQFAPNGLVAVPNGQVCSKDCQCGATSHCFDNKCTRKTTRGLRQLLQTTTAGDKRILASADDIPMVIVLLLIGGVMGVALLTVVWPGSCSKARLQKQQVTMQSNDGTETNSKNMDLLDVVKDSPASSVTGFGDEI